MSNVEKLILQHTDLDLNTSPVLTEAPVDVGLGPDSLSADTRAALKTGFIDISDPSGAYNTPPRYNVETHKSIDAPLTDSGFAGLASEFER